MIETLSIFPKQCALNSQPVIEAVIQSASRRNIRIEENSLDSDAVVIWSVLWKGRMAANQAVYQHYRQHNRPVIVIDVGSLHRGTTWKIGINNINRLAEFGNHSNLDWNRPRQLGVQLQPEQSGDHILVAAQHHNSLQLASLSSQESWISQVVTEVKKYTDRPVIVREHPRSPLNRQLLPKDITFQKPCRVANTYDNFDFDLNNTHAVINFSSSPGIQAAINGHATFVSTDSLAYDVANDLDFLHDIETPAKFDKQKWLVELSHCEYLVEEIAAGVWIDRLGDFL